MATTIVSFDIGVKNLAVCILSIDKDTINIITWKIISLAAKEEKTPVLNEISGRLFLELDTLIDDINVPIDYIILENQPSNLNGTMKSIQMMIYTFFQLRKHWEGLSKQVYLVSASDKLKGHDEIIKNIEPSKYENIEDNQKKTAKQKKSAGYKKNKKLAIEITKKYLEKNPEVLNLFCSYKKMDDMADSFLQAISWSRKNFTFVIPEDIKLSSKTI